MKRILSVLLALVMVIGMFPMGILSASAAETEVVFELGANGSATHNDGKDATTYTETVDGYTLSVTGGTKMYTGAIDGKGNGCIKLGTGSAVGGFSIAVPNDVTSVVINVAGYKAKTVTVDVNGESHTISTMSNNGEYTAITINTITTKTITLTTSTNYRAMVNSITFVCGSGTETTCDHANTSDVEAVAATCTADGFTAGVYCNDCESYIEGHEIVEALGHTNDEGVVTEATCTEDGYTLYTCTVCGSTKKDNYVDATGHTYVDGVCSACGIAKPAGLDGKYYIAAIRKTGNYFYMTSTKDSNKDRFVAVDSGLTELPASIETVVDSQVFELVASGDAYKIKAGDQYLGWTSGNVAVLTTEDAAVVTTIENGENGAYVIHFAATDKERYLALNANADNNYFLWYGEGQTDELYLIPVSENAEVCEHANTTTEGAVAASCTTAGSTGSVVCSDCGVTVTEATVIDALGHNYVDGVCTNCNEAEPSTSNGVYQLVTDVSTLADGDTIVIVAATTDYALSTNQKSNNRGQVAITKDGNIVEINDEVQILTLEAGTTANTFAFNTGSGYLYAASSSSNHLKTQTTNDANGIWSISIDADGIATVKATGTNTRNWMRHNASSSLFACYASNQADISIYKYTIVDGCVHEVAEDAWTIVTPATCETTGSKTGSCSKCGETVEKEIPALGHSYSYNAETGMMVCANCGNSFMNTIAEAKAYTDTNKVYYFKGIVTYVSGKTVYVQDDTAGVCVYFTDTDNAAGIAAGDELLVWDSMTTYGGLIETSYTTSSEVQVLSSGNELPAAQSATLAELLANPNDYQGERVTLSGMTMGLVNTSGNTVLTDTESETINLYQAKGMAANVTENDIVDITVVFSIYSNAYQLLLNQSTATTDVVVTTEGVPSDLELSTIATAKAGTEGTFYKVKGIVTFVDGASVYMQDATAGIVARLATGVTAPAIGTEIEAIGAYTTYYGLIQLESATFEVISSGNTVVAKEVTLVDLKDDTYLSEKVSLNEVEITAVGTYSTSHKNVDYTVTDGTNEIKMYRTPAATEADVLAVGDVINVTAVLSTYNGYQLRVAAESDITKAAGVAAIGDTQYYSFEAAYKAAGEGDVIKLLANAGEDSAVELTKDLYVDLNGFFMTASAAEGTAYTVYGMDSCTDSYEADEWGYLTVTGATVAPLYNSYLAVDEGDLGWSFHAYSAKLTFVSLDPTNDALGYKAQFYGDEMVLDHVTGFGYNLWVNEDKVVTKGYETAFTNGQIVTLRLKGIMAADGGEMEIFANAYVTFDTVDGQVTSKNYSTTMQETIEKIAANVETNVNAYSEAQMIAIQGLIATYESKMEGWNIDAIKAWGAEG